MAKSHNNNWQKKLVTMRIRDEYRSFIEQSSTYDSEWGNISGACHKYLKMKMENLFMINIPNHMKI